LDRGQRPGLHGSGIFLRRVNGAGEGKKCRVAAQYNGPAPRAVIACGAPVNERGADMKHFDQHDDRLVRLPSGFLMSAA
jgi:hypothetical protein